MSEHINERLRVYDPESFEKLKISIAEHLRNKGQIVPPDEELADYAKSLLSFFEILIEADTQD